ncbi:hypothetical protein PC116_g2696 [Phytophthora cactorum]|uniref:Uncharacterized protein n=1 Tax=Phytophthora cactorum TaxID=29920 RepID=A0A8T1LJ33_9STRA|nr:hypothetical protein PC114_g24897 [Phytophthora cactorum]KAG2896441.1 hypothetical protein PC117_g23009 [Phytophthora cactorum]KAG2968513.1 hypothetical protein PC119_g24188 [Phytophthora cactorum]KAG3031913.1 hypothetical protein PC120_g2812 [Phytophthora cactorum]KAG3195106.1 hypothetical protein PC128_g8764 [Phytophthora cactorum]
MKPTTVNPLKLNMSYTALAIVHMIAKEMGTSFSLMFNSWTSHSLHFLAIYAVYVLNGERCQRPLSFSPMEDGQTAEAHLEHIASVSDFTRKTSIWCGFLWRTIV